MGHAAHRCQGLELSITPQSLLTACQAPPPTVFFIPSGLRHAIDHAMIILKRGLLLLGLNHLKTFEQLISFTTLIAVLKLWPKEQELSSIPCDSTQISEYQRRQVTFGFKILRLIKRNPVGRASGEYSRERLLNEQGNMVWLE